MLINPPVQRRGVERTPSETPLKVARTEPVPSEPPRPLNYPGERRQRSERRRDNQPVAVDRRRGDRRQRRRGQRQGQQRRRARPGVNQFVENSSSNQQSRWRRCGRYIDERV